jgi:two-component system, NtrC family, sensor kinase
VENRSHPSIKATTHQLSLYLDSEILQDLTGRGFDLSGFDVTDNPSAFLSLYKKNGRLWVCYQSGEYCDFPYYFQNIYRILKFASNQQILSDHNETFESLIKTSQSIERRMFSSVSLMPGQNFKDLWDEVIKKINAISADCHSLNSLVEKLLEVPFLQNFQSSLIILHLKGQTQATFTGTIWRNDKYHGLLEVKDFNVFYTSVKKSKIKSFSTDLFPKINFPFNGSFLAKDVTSKKYSLLAVASRNDFLPYSKEEIDLFETCIDLLMPHFERLIDQEFSDKRISELRVCLKDFPLPLRIRDSLSGTSFLNDLYSPEQQEKDIFFSKKVGGPFSLDLYDSDELRHYAFDLFHFQRISLLGELLNTLRHELSNPLFGLKLGSQIFGTLDTSAENKEIMLEIEKNVNRCQLIIENFSNLYQIQSEKKPVSVKKLIDESLVLSKSESRELKKLVTYHQGSEDISLNVPIIFVVQIIFNLIVNSSQAIKEQERKGELRLEVTTQGKEVHLDVIDNGPGIPADKVSSLFKPFFTTKIQGTGLGLVLSRNLALKMGGNLEYLVNNNHAGAHFRLTLPIHE